MAITISASLRVMVPRGVVGLDGNGDGSSGDDATFVDAFFRLYGDSNGDGVVDRSDLGDFRSGLPESNWRCQL